MEQTNVLVIGQGAREHALCQTLAGSPLVDKIWASPGNPGLAELARIVPGQDVAAWVELAETTGALTVIGPEVPLAAGLSDALRERGIPVVGPSRLGARLESSKIFAKEIMAKVGIPTARSVTVENVHGLAARVGRDWPFPVVIKQDGLAQGKGVSVILDQSQWQDFLRENAKASGPWILEEYLEGREISVQVLTNGQAYVWLPTAVDHKRLTADPKSPNTGGMGAYSPVPWLTASDRRAIETHVLEPVIGYLSDARVDYRGVLYVGLMMTRSGPYVLEFNVRFGDPEAEVILPLIADDFFVWLRELAEGRLLKPTVELINKRAVGVVLASQGYPEQPKTGRPIQITKRVPGARIFQAGTQVIDGRLCSSGGRVMTIVGLGDDFAAARNTAYQQLSEITMEGGQFRVDIGKNLEADG